MKLFRSLYLQFNKIKTKTNEFAIKKENKL